MEAAAVSTEMTILGWSAGLLILQIVLQMLAYVKDVGLVYAMSNRDGSRSAGPLAQRLQRGISNFVETYGAFVALAVALAFTGKTGELGAIGAQIWFWARVAYILVFAAGIPFLRTGVWTVSMAGLVLMFIRLAA